jgi:thymidylate synthase (FAD)
MGIELIHRTPDAERLIVKMARVSAPQNADNMETGPRLLRYLIRHKHWSPFEMASMCVKIDTERDIAAQILRHRSFSFQEWSTRYATAQEPAMPALRRQDNKNRQNSFDDLPAELTAELLERIQSVFGATSKLYNDMLEAGVAKETARRILPLSTRTTLFMHGSLRSWIHYLEVRCDPATQLEHRQIADGIRAIFSAEFPTISEALYGADS